MNREWYFINIQGGGGGADYWDKIVILWIFIGSKRYNEKITVNKS